ncbi:MAG: endonuclease [Phycisphaerales bacterium]
MCLIAFQGLALASDPWAPPVGYYDAATGAGSTLKSELYDIMRTGHLQRSYGDYRYSAAITDADPNHPGNIILIYNDASVSASWDSGATWNREHVWPQSLQPGDASNSTTGNLGDPHALRPANPSINSSRGNKPYGFDATTGVYGSQGSYYFPGDNDKGDIARTLFYSDTRWGPEKGISLVDTVPSSNQMGDLSSIIAWNYLDPPSEFERRRNHAIYSSALNPTYYTNNRNAYVDHPEYVWSIYMDQNNDSQLYVGIAPNADGSSETSINFPPVFVGAATPTANVEIHKAGFDGTYFAVTTTADAWSDAADTFNAFPILNAPFMTDDATILVGIDPAYTATPGNKGGDVIIDNLDVTSGAGLGFAALDADDVIHVSAPVYRHAEGSFDVPANVDTLDHDFGTVAVGAAATFSFPVYNIQPATPTGELWIVPGAVSGDAEFSLDLIDELINPGTSTTLTVTLDTSVAGSYSSSFEIIASDNPAWPGAILDEPLVLNVTATVGAGCPADLDNSGTLNLDDVNLFANAFAASDLLADVDGNGVLNLDDVNTFALSFVAGCP